MSELADDLANQFRDHAGELPGAGLQRVVEARERAFSQFEAAGLPTTKLEDWKYTDLAALRSAGLVALGKRCGDADPGALKLSELSLPEFSGHVVAFLDGEFLPHLSSIDSLPKGARLTTIGPLLQQESGEILRRMSSHDAAFPSLNSAFLKDGVYLDLAGGTVIDEPVHVIFLSSSTDSPQLNNARLIVTAQTMSSCTIVESHYGLHNARGMTNALTDIEAKDGTSVLHYRIQAEDLGTHHIGNVFVTAGKDASVETYSFVFGGGVTRVDVNADLVGPGASVVLNGLFMANDNQHIDHHTRVRHRVGQTVSNENYKGIADGTGRGVFNGKVIVAEGAQKIEALQSSKNLLLSDRAEIDTKPELEIYADDVKCAHGATVGQLDGDALFYLRSRGIDEQSARGILTFAFAADIASDIDIEPLREWLEKRIMARTQRIGIEEIENNG